MTSSGAGAQRGRFGLDESSLEQVPVRIGEVQVARGASVLFTIGLGSCVAVALYDAALRIGGLAHAMLPRPERGFRAGPPGRFTATAVPHLVAMMVEAGAAPGRLRARLAGGASMFPDLLDREGLQLGRRNVEAARLALQECGIPLDAEDVFGRYGRSVFLRTTDGLLRVTSIEHGEVTL